MRSHELADGPGSRYPTIGSGRWNSTHVGIVFWNRRRLGLVLVLLILLPWIPTPGSVPTSGPARRLRFRQGDYLIRVAFAPDGRSLATTDIQGRVSLLPLGEEGDGEQGLGDQGHGRVLAYSPDGRYLLMAGDTAGIVRCDLSRRVTLRLPGIEVADTSDLKIAPDGRTLATASFQSSEIVVWEMDSGRVRWNLQGHRSAVIRLAFAPDGRSLASAAAQDGRICIWDLDLRPRLLRSIPAPGVLALAYSPDGRLLASASSGEPAVRIWDVRAGTGAGVDAEAVQPARIIAGHRLPVRSVAFSPDGTLLAAASGDGSASLWSVATGRERCRLNTQAPVLTDIAFSPDGRMLAAAATDANVRLWNLSPLVPDQVGPE
ncbi:MAG: WD40 repeat domain-containing protein [Isosphaeraceae bacterium]